MDKKVFGVILLALLMCILPQAARAQPEQTGEAVEFILTAEDIEKWGVVQSGDGLDMPKVSEATVLVLTRDAAFDMNKYLGLPGKKNVFFEDIPMRIRGFINERVMLITHDDTMQGIMGLLPEDRQTITRFSDAFY